MLQFPPDLKLFFMTLLIDIQKELKGLEDPEIAAHSQRFFKTGKGQYGECDQFIGIRVPALRKIVKKYKAISIDEATDLLKSPLHEQRLLALLMLVNLFKKAAPKDQDKTYGIYMTNTRYINNWDLVDNSAPYIPGPYLFKKSKKPLYDFSFSSDLWEKRIAIISTFYFIRQNEFKDTLNIAENLIQDKEDLIHKAVGWMLREVGKRDMHMEEQFLIPHYKYMPRTMLRYAIERFPEPLRQQYLKGTR